VRGERHKNLPRDRAHPNEQRSDQEGHRLRGDACADQRRHGDAEDDEHEAPVLEHVAEWDD